MDYREFYRKALTKKRNWAAVRWVLANMVCLVMVLLAIRAVVSLDDYLMAAINLGVALYWTLIVARDEAKLFDLFNSELEKLRIEDSYGR